MMRDTDTFADNDLKISDTFMESVCWTYRTKCKNPKVSDQIQNDFSTAQRNSPQVQRVTKSKPRAVQETRLYYLESTSEWAPLNKMWGWDEDL